MLRGARQKPMANLIKVRQTKAVHQAVARGCIDSLKAMSGLTRERIAVSRALLGRITDRGAASRPPAPTDTIERSPPHRFAGLA